MEGPEKQDENRIERPWLEPTQFKPGQSGNPGGRPKGSRSITKIIRQLLDEGMEGHDIAEALAKTGVKHALKGDHRFWKEIVDRTDGKVPDRIAGADGGPIQIAAMRLGMDALANDPEAREALKVLARRQTELLKNDDTGNGQHD